MGRGHRPASLRTKEGVGVEAKEEDNRRLVVEVSSWLLLIKRIIHATLRVKAARNSRVRRDEQPLFRRSGKVIRMVFRFCFVPRSLYPTTTDTTKLRVRVVHSKLSVISLTQGEMSVTSRDESW